MRLLLLIISFFVTCSCALANGKQHDAKVAVMKSGTLAQATQYNHPEIELSYTTGTYSAQAGQSWQKTAELLSLTLKTKPGNITTKVVPAIAPLFLSNNNYLFHNYPSHNFW